MMRISKWCVLGVALCLLTLQLSGTHGHTNVDGFSGTPQSAFTHSHHHAHGGPPHQHTEHALPAGDEGEDLTDVMLLDAALAAFKMTLAFIIFLLFFSCPPGSRVLAGTVFVFRVRSARHARWRPPLRAHPRAYFTP